MTDKNKNAYEMAGISPDVYAFGKRVWEECTPRFQTIDDNCEIRSLQVLKAFHDHNVSAEHLYGTTGYGYNDRGRDTLEAIYAEIFETEDALVRSQITCGTHAITLALSAILRPGDTLLSPVGAPYDTLEGILGQKEESIPGNLKEFGITYSQVDLLPDSTFDYPAIEQALTPQTKMVTIQKSKGYSARKTLSNGQIKELITFVKEKAPWVICMVDNCYGEFVENHEPGACGADLIVGSLIKNPGGGLAPMGGYVCGRKDLIEQCAARLTAPGLGKEVGASLEINRTFYQGLYQAPSVVANALKAAIFSAAIYERLGYFVNPGPKDPRFDIIQAVKFHAPEAIIAFCKGIQASSPVDSYVIPEPYAMPGYHSDVIMAAGTFISGASIELSADAPIEEPYQVYFQGGLTWPHGKYGILMSLEYLVREGLVTLPDL